MSEGPTHIKIQKPTHLKVNSCSGRIYQVLLLRSSQCYPEYRKYLNLNFGLISEFPIFLNFDKMSGFITIKKCVYKIVGTCGIVCVEIKVYTL